MSRELVEVGRVGFVLTAALAGVAWGGAHSAGAAVASGAEVPSRAWVALMVGAVLALGAGLATRAHARQGRLGRVSPSVARVLGVTVAFALPWQVVRVWAAGGTGTEYLVAIVGAVALAGALAGLWVLVLRRSVPNDARDIT